MQHANPARFIRSLLVLSGIVLLTACGAPKPQYDDTAPDHCTNDFADPITETDKDCGAECDPCANGLTCADANDCINGSCIENVCQLSHCLDTVKSGNETDVNCGGACQPCDDGDACGSDADCKSANCDDAELVCVAGDCRDGDQNGEETDADCGGPDCEPCEIGEHCQSGPDCVSGSCVGGTCEGASCADGTLNGDETDVDCGGGTCPGCGVLQDCVEGTDCETGTCRDEICQDATCVNGELDATETDIDCGGAGCGPCGPGLNCAIAADCDSGICTDGVCATPACDDTITNGTETDMDCGGGCSPCADELACGIDADCLSVVCEGAVCVAATCTDTVTNGSETDVDCGGPCSPCTVGQACLVAADCDSDTCGNQVCVLVECTDGNFNGGETDLDCGGPYCGKCADGQDCLSASDCLSGICGADGTCADAVCTDEVVNGDETDVDCGGADCNACAVGSICEVADDCVEGVCGGNGTCPAASCSDTVANGSESDADCGGPSCPKCADSLLCIEHSDCQSGRCVGGNCAEPTCSDLVKNGDESAQDCGGSCDTKCANQESCLVGSDCISGYCDPTSLVCTDPGCTDGVKNGTETDLNCGGTDCVGCAIGQICVVDTDCATRNCGAPTGSPAVSRCAAASCSNDKVDGSETDVDCGGTCPACGTGQRCGAGGDCISLVCTTSGDATELTCQAASCSDGTKNQGESAVDCGIAACGGCSPGLTCTQGSNCASLICDTSVAPSVCTTSSCTDGTRNGSESGVDCGGTCTTCPNGDPCNGDSDCTSRSCGTDGDCAAPTCSDGRTNGNETGLDCGGADCRSTSKCPNDAGCGVGADCQSGYCDGTVCASPGCTDGAKNGTESDVDCGGVDCRVNYPCDVGDTCGTGIDCVSRVCSATVCAVATCGDATRNGVETDTDCGGTDCLALASPKRCADGKLCSVAADCQSRVCGGSGTCSVPACTDGQFNGVETDTDCGGATCRNLATPKLCANGLDCAIDGDCVSAICNPTTGTCTAPSCTDGKLNQNETAIDCGGSICVAIGRQCVNGAACLVNSDCTNGFCTPDTKVCATPSCADGYKNRDESDVNCGGTFCPDCVDGKTCVSGADCVSGACQGNLCVSCSDGMKNQTETDVDCGGVCAPAKKCVDKKICAVDGDCASNDCVSGICVSCNDGVKNRDESDIDCGGTYCADCVDGKTCNAVGDCVSGACAGTPKRCISCDDNLKNQNESDIDCGGVCADCANGLICGVAGDCASAYCNPTLRCSAISCTDTWKNGSETDVDCGGTCSLKCAVNQACLVDADCRAYTNTTPDCPTADHLCDANCNAGYANCSGDAACETDITDQVNNCGGCGVVCSGATPYCVGTGCVSSDTIVEENEQTFLSADDDPVVSYTVSTAASKNPALVVVVSSSSAITSVSVGSTAMTLIYAANDDAVTYQSAYFLTGAGLASLDTAGSKSISVNLVTNARGAVVSVIELRGVYQGTTAAAVIGASASGGTSSDCNNGTGAVPQRFSSFNPLAGTWTFHGLSYLQATAGTAAPAAPLVELWEAKVPAPIDNNNAAGSAGASRAVAANTLFTSNYTNTSCNKIAGGIFSLIPGIP